MTLTTAQLPGHTHGLNNHSHSTPNHTHTGSAALGGAHTHLIDVDEHTTDTSHRHEGPGAVAAAPGESGTTNPNEAGIVQSGGSTHTHSLSISSSGGGTSGPASGTTASAGSGTAHENMPPFLVVNFIVKV